MKRQTKLLLLIPHLGGGGAERVLAELARGLDPLRFEIHLGAVTQDFPGALPLPSWVQIHGLGRNRVRQAALPLIRLLRAIEPDIVLSGMAHLSFLLLLLKPFLPPGTRILARQNTTASAAAQTWRSRLPYRFLYPIADRILCQSNAMADDLADNFAIAREKLVVLANPIDIAAIRRAGAAPNQPAEWPRGSWPRLLAAGRLAPEKGIDLLLRALAQVRPQYPRLHLQILGEGPEEAKLRRLARELTLDPAVTFCGFQENLSAFHAGATCFVLSSRFEGMPNALLEAAAAGLPLIATPCSRGLCDLLLDRSERLPGVWLAASISADSLAETLLGALSALQPDPAAPQRFEHAFLAPFERANAVRAYAALFESVAREANP